ncbi:MAG: valine--tRNA ligase [Oscillospiraceae bacterium]|nr:valine--tRNA ligase [Oscillospiraceae bacterium]
MKQLEKVYDPKQVEDRIYKLWNDGGHFRGHVDPAKKPFTIVIPPPNVTGQLHLGHAFNNTLQDILMRYKRMQGYAALWVPGTDHAGIATQIRVEEELRGEGLTRHDLGRDKFLERVWDWKNTYGSRIIEQLKKLGSSCDWERERFTMDDGCSRAVREVFVALYEKGLIYKGNRIINWCPDCATALSDAEVEHEDQTGSLWHIKYPVKGSDEYLTVATTRPETMLGDTGVAVHPDDERYSHLVGKTVVLPLMGREIPIIADEYVDREFGTGCVKMTPCHDPNDFEVGQRHGLAQVLMLDESAKVINSGKYDGLDRYAAREAVLHDLEALGLLAGIETHEHSVGICYRCDTVVEPITSDQWFVKMAPLAKGAIEVVENGETKFVPERFAKIYTHWMENVRDWCISRQLWWGHRIPVWYCSCGHMTVSRDDPDKCEKCGSSDIERDPDVLDTWFSSALWPFSTLGWPDKTPDLDYFYPTDVLVTGYDIIFFWVARMIFSGVEHMNKTPFHTVFINGLIRDSEGRKMSKSLGNGVDPIDIIEAYGADALRFNIITGNSPGNDIRFYPEKCEAMRNFANKIWNASRFVMMNITDAPVDAAALGSVDPKKPAANADDSSRLAALPDKLELEDKWILSKLNTLAGEICENLDKYEIGVASSKIYDFIWDDFCDWYIELSKPRLQRGGLDASNAQSVLLYVLTETLTLLHPFMPFITEEVYQALPHRAPASPQRTAAAQQAVATGRSDVTSSSDPAAQSSSTASHQTTIQTNPAAPRQTAAQTNPASTSGSDVLMIRPFPVFKESLAFPEDEADFESIITAVRAVRARRAEMNVPPSKKPSLIIVTDKLGVFEAGRAYLSRLAYAGELTITREAPPDASGLVAVITGDARLYMPLSELVDVEKERERIGKEIAKTRSDIERFEQKLSNEQFTSKAPEHVINAEREKLAKLRALLDNLLASASVL